MQMCEILYVSVAGLTSVISDTFYTGSGRYKKSF